MTYLELYEDALRKLNKNLITVGEFEMMISPLNREVEAEPKTGEWVKREKIGLDENNIETCLYYWYECSECGHKPPCDPFRNEWYSSYCPNCGAKMLGEDGEA